MDPTNGENSASSSPLQQTSLDRLYGAVGGTVASGLASLGSRFSAQKAAESAAEPQLAAEPQPAANASDGEIASTADFVEGNGIVSAADPEPTATEKQRTPREAALEQECARLNSEVTQLRLEVQTHARAASRAARVVDALRVARDEELSVADTAAGGGRRLRKVNRDPETSALEKERAKCRAAAEAAKAAGRQSAALERVCAGLRSRLAVSEERAARALQLDKEIMAKERAEAELDGMKLKLEQCETRVVTLEAEARVREEAERSRQETSERISELEDELSARDRLLRGMDADRARLSSYLLRYEDQFQQKEAEIVDLRRRLSRKGEDSSRPGDNSMGPGSRDSTADSAFSARTGRDISERSSHDRHSDEGGSAEDGSRGWGGDGEVTGTLFSPDDEAATDATDATGSYAQGHSSGLVQDTTGGSHGGEGGPGDDEDELEYDEEMTLTVNYP